MLFAVTGQTFHSYYERKEEPQPFEIMVEASGERRAREIARVAIESMRRRTAQVWEARPVQVVRTPSEDEIALDLGAPWYEARLYAFDVETTGFSFERDRITELGFSRFDAASRSFADPVSYLVNEGKPIPQKLLDLKINDITNESLQGKPSVAELMEQGALDEFLAPDVILVSHNRGFDKGHLLATLGRMGYEGHIPPVVCSMELARVTKMGQKKNKLEVLAGMMGLLDGEQSHRAGDDARMCGEVFLRLARHPDNLAFFKTASVADMLERFDNTKVGR